MASSATKARAGMPVLPLLLSHGVLLRAALSRWIAT